MFGEMQGAGAGSGCARGFYGTVRWHPCEQHCRNWPAKNISETGVALRIRRIEAVAGPAVLEYLNLRDGIVRDLSERFKAKPERSLSGLLLCS